MGAYVLPKSFCVICRCDERSPPVYGDSKVDEMLLVRGKDIDFERGPARRLLGCAKPTVRWSSSGGCDNSTSVRSSGRCPE